MLTCCVQLNPIKKRAAATSGVDKMRDHGNLGASLTLRPSSSSDEQLCQKNSESAVKHDKPNPSRDARPARRIRKKPRNLVIRDAHGYSLDLVDDEVHGHDHDFRHDKCMLQAVHKTCVPPFAVENNLGATNGSRLVSTKGSPLTSARRSRLGSTKGALLSSIKGSILGSTKGSLLGLTEGSLLGSTKGSLRSGVSRRSGDTHGNIQG